METYYKGPNDLRFCLSSLGMGFEMQTVAAELYFSRSRAAHGSWGLCLVPQATQIRDKASL